MAVVLVGPVPPPYQGMTVYTKMLLEELDALGVPVHWVDSSDHRGLSNMGRIDWDNVSGAVRTAIAILGSVRLKAPRLLYLPIAQSRLPFVRDALHLLLGRLVGARLVVHLHGASFARFYSAEPPIMRWLMRSAMDGCSAIIVLTESLAAQFDGIATRPAICVVPNAVASAADSDIIEARYADIGRRLIRVAFLAAITGPKGAVDFARAIESLPEGVRSRASFVIAGNPDDHYADDYERVCEIMDRLAAQGVDARVGGVVEGPEKADFFAGTDVFVLPSYNEGQPLAILEALSAGCAVISTRVGGLCETVSEGQEALLVPAGDIESLSNAMRGLISDPGSLVSVGRMGRRRWERCYQPGPHARAMAELFERVLKGLDDDRQIRATRPAC